MGRRRPWWLKAAVQGALSQLPQPQRFNRMLQRYVTRSLQLRPQTFARKWERAQQHLQHWGDARDRKATVAVELGTGWHPIVPVGLALLGVEQVYTLDINPMISPRTLGEVLRAYAAGLDSGAVAVSGPRATLLQSVARAPIVDVDETLARLGVAALVVDARNTGLPAASVDLFVSNNTLEHVPADTIAAVFGEYARISAVDGVMSHFVDMSDHYAGFDRTITVYNFLRFSDAVWRMFNNELQYQNRLRVTDFRRLLDDQCWRIIVEKNTSDHAAFSRTSLAPKFAAYPPEDCMVYASWLVAELDAARDAD